MWQATQPATRGLAACMWGHGRWVWPGRCLVVAIGSNLFAFSCRIRLAKQIYTAQYKILSLLSPAVRCLPKCYPAWLLAAGRTCGLSCRCSANTRSHEIAFGPVDSVRRACAILGCRMRNPKCSVYHFRVQSQIIKLGCCWQHPKR